MADESNSTSDQTPQQSQQQHHINLNEGNATAIESISERLSEVAGLAEQLDMALRGAQQDCALATPPASSSTINANIIGPIKKIFDDNTTAAGVASPTENWYAQNSEKKPTTPSRFDDVKSDDEFLTASECTVQSRSSSFHTTSECGALSPWWELDRSVSPREDLHKEKMVIAVGLPELPNPKSVLKPSPEVPPGKIVHEVTETTHLKVQHCHTLDVSSYVLTSETVKDGKNLAGAQHQNLSTVTEKIVHEDRVKYIPEGREVIVPVNVETSVTTDANDLLLKQFKESGDWILLKILELEPDLTLLGDTLVEALELQKAHNEVLLQLQNKQSPVEELLRQADQLISTQKPRTEVYAAMAESLALAWKDVNAHLEQRRQILDMNVSYHQKADDCHDKMKVLEMACNDTMIPIEIDAVKNFLTNIHDMRRAVLESLMVALQQGTALLDKLKELAEQGTLDSRPQKIKIPVQQAIAQVERWMESLHDRRRLLELSWESRKLQLEQCLALAFLAKDLRDLENTILQRREILNNNDHLGDSAASAELFYNEHDKLYKEAKDLQDKSLKITKATEQFVSSGCFAGEQATAQAYGVLDLATQYLTDLEAKMELLTSAIDFFKSAQHALDKLQQMEIELVSPNLSRVEVIKLHSESEKAIKEIADPPIEAGYALLEATGRSTGTEHVKFMVEQLESRKIFLDSLCVAHKEEHRRVMEALDNFLKRQNELHTWLIDIAEAFLQSHQDMGSDVVLAQDFLDLHTQLLRDIQEKGTEINTLLLTLPPILEYLEHSERQDLDKKVENLHERWINIKNILEGRLDLASLYVQFLTQTNELDAAMTSLENSVKNKNEKLNENVISKLEEQWLSLKPLYNKLKALGHQFIEDVHKVSDPNLDSQRAILCVESTLERLANKQLTVSESWQTWQTELSERRETLIQWEKNIVESNKTIDLATKLDSELYPIITTGSTEPLHIVSDLEDKLDTTLEEMKRTQKGIEECLRITESLSQKSSEVQNEKVETKLNELNNKFSNDITEYSLLTQMIISYFKHINEIQKKIESYKQKYDNEKLSNDVAQTEHLIHEHNSSNQILQEMFNFSQNECDRLISKINKQEPGDAAQKDISRILYPLKQLRNDWDNMWEERRKVLEDHLQLCHFDSDLHQINDTLDDLGKQLNGIKGKYGESLAEAKATSLAFVYFEKTIELLEDRLKEFGNTAENMLKNQHIHSPHIEAELNKLRNRWNDFRTQVQDTRHLIDLSIKYFETVLKAEEWFKEGNQLLRTIARKSSLVKTPEEATELLNELETFLKPGEQKQDERIREISKMAFELFGHEQPIQVNKVILENQELTDSFSSIINELNILANNLKLAEEQRIKDIEAQRLRDIEEQRIREAEELLEKQRAEAARIEAEKAKAKAEAAKAEADAAKAEADAAKAQAEAAKAAAAAAEEACKTAAKTLNDAAEEFKQKTIVINTTIEKSTLIETQKLVPEKLLITDGTQTIDKVQKTEISQTETTPQQVEEHVVHIIPIEKEKSDDIQIEEIPQLEAPRFIVPLTDIIIQEGSSFTFKCHVTGYPLPVIQWFKDGISIESNLDYQTNFENGVCALTIEETFTEDSARFTCKARNAVGSAETSAYLSVKETEPDEQLIPPYFTKTLTPALAREGSKFQFECGVQGNPLPTVQWFKNDTCIDNSSDYVITYNNGEAILTFEEVFLEDNATFTCRAENPLGVIESTANLNVEPLEPTEIPTFSVPLSNVMARAGQKIKLECSFSGIPEPKISWTHNGHLLQESHDVKLLCQNNTATLIVPEAFPKDAGIYSAIASNLAGEAVSSCNVTVKGRLPVETSDSEFASDMEPIKPKIQTPLKDVSVFEGSRVRLDCVIVGQPEPEVIWYHDDQPVKESTDFQLLFQGDKCSLIIEEAYLEDAGEYKAVAINSAGEATSSCRLSVSSLEITEHPTRKPQPERILPSGSPPVFTKLLLDVLISEGESVTLECVVTGDPKPEIKWLLNNQEIKEDSRIKLTHGDDGKVTLQIEKVTSDDRGVYTIRASNPSGDAKCFAQLIVKSLRGAPEIKPKTPSNEIEIPIQVTEEVKKTSTEIIPTVITDVTPTSNLSEKSSVSLTQNAYTIETSSETTSIVYNNKSCEYSDKSETEVHKFDLHVDEPLKPIEAKKSIEQTDVKKIEEKTIEIIKTESKPTRKLIPPKFLTPVMGKIVDENTTVVLEGVLEGYPTPTVTWTKNGHAIPENDERISVTWDLNKTKIEIKDATSVDAGKYTCQAINDAGSATCTADIVVKKKTFPPVFGRRLQAQLIKKGERVVMEVEVTGLPDPTISWFKDGQPLTTEPNNLTLKSQGNCHTLIIEKAAVEHSGKYMVRAVNSSGEAQSIADFAVFEPCPDTMVEVVKTLVFEDAQKLEQLQSSAESSFTKTTQESSTVEKIKSAPEASKVPISSNIIQTHVSEHKESSYNFETKSIPVISQDSSKVIEHKIETTEKIEKPVPVEKKEPVIIQPIEINKDLTDSRTTIEDFPDKINIIDENRSFQHSVKQEISFNIKKHYNEGYKPEISLPEVPQILPQLPKFETKTEIHQESSITKQIPIQIETKEEQIILPKLPDVTPISVLSEAPIVTQIPIEVPKEEEEARSIIDSSSITKESAYEFFKTKLEENSEPIPVDRTHLPEKVQHSYIEFEKAKFSESVPKQEVEEICTRTYVKAPPIDVRTEDIIRVDQKSTKTELISEPFNLVPEPPPEMGYMPKASTESYQREDISHKIKKLESNHQELPSSQIPSGGIKIYPTPQENNVEKKTETTTTFLKSEQYTIEKEGPIYRPQAEISTRPLTPKPSAEAIEMEKLWIPSKSPEPYVTETKSYSYDQQIKEMKSFDSEPGYAASTSSFETLSYSRPHSSLSTSVEKPSAEGIAMEKSWAHKHVGSHAKVWPPPETEVQPTATPLWTSNLTESVSQTKQTKEYSSTQYTQKFESSQPITPVISQPVQYYRSETSQLQHKMNIPETTEYSSSKTISSMESNELVIEEKNIKPSEVKKTSTFITKDYELKSPAIVKNIEPKREEIKPLEIIRPISVQDITDEIYLEPGSPPEIAFAEPPPQTRRLSYVETIEQELEQNLEKVPSKVLPGSVRTIPPPPPPKEKSLPPVLPPRKEKLATPPPLPAKPAFIKPIPSYEPLPPKEFKEEKFSSTSMTSSFVTESSTIKDIGFRSVKPPTTLPRSKSTEPYIPPPNFVTPTIQQTQQIQRPFSTISSTTTHKTFTSHTLPRKKSPPKSLSPINLQPGSPPEYLRAEAPKSPQVKPKVADTGYMADTDEPFIQYKSNISSTQETHTVQEKHFYHKKVDQKHISRSTAQNHVIKEDKKYVRQNSAPSKTLTTPEIVKKYEIETKIQRDERDSSLEAFPYKPDPPRTKRTKCPPPPSPSKFIKGEFRESDYESDFDGRIQPIWNKGDKHYKPIHPVLNCNNRPQSVTKSPIPPTEFDNPPKIDGPPRPKFEPIEKPKQVYSKFHEKSQTTQKQQTLIKPKAISAQLVGSPITPKTTTVINYIKPGSPPELSYAPPPQKVQYYRSTTSAPYHNATQTETSNIVQFNESTENSHRVVNIQQTTKIIKFGDKPKSKITEITPQSNNIYLRRGSLPQTPTPSKFIRGEFRESDYESEFESAKIRPKWAPGDSDTDEPHYRRVRAPAMHRSSSVPARKERVLTPMEFDTQPPLMPTKITFESTDDERAKKSVRRQFSKDFKQQQQRNVSKVSKVIAPYNNNIQPGSPPEYGYIPSQTVASTATKIATKHMDEMTSTFKSKAQQFAQDIMTDVNKKQQPKQTKSITKGTDSDAQVYREESRIAQHGTKHVDPDTGLIYFKYDFGYEFGIVLPGVGKNGEIPQPTKTIIAPPKRDSDIEVPIIHESTSGSSSIKKGARKVPKYDSESELSEMADTDFNRRKRVNSLPQPSDYSTQNPPYIRIPNTPSPNSLSPSIPSISPAYNNLGYQVETPTSALSSPRNIQSDHIRPSDQPPKPPMFITPLRDIAVIAGQTAKFECIVQAEPTPNIIWTKNGRIIANCSDYQAYYRNGVCRLTIPKAYPGDAGTYNCTATNSQGTASTTANLQVPGERRSSYI